MPDLLTPQALATAGPLVLETFFKHFLVRGNEKDKGKAREDLMYDEAFVLMKTFLEIATEHPVASLQKFSLVRTPSPPWVAVHRVAIPQETMVSAADNLVKAFGGPEMAYRIAGGTKWWQVRAGAGVEAEWIVLKKDRKEMVRKGAEQQVRAEEQEKRKVEGTDEDEEDRFRPEMNELRCMLYIHGGAYYWGSINTHRYTIWRYARKMHGRCFAVNYRKAPQYPFPCAIQDVLAAYLYLVNPPAGAEHRPVDPKNIIVAGDSAGGGLVWALLQILRDTDGLELPAGAVLISPWSDLTHSFPSILKNTATDIVPPYGFIHKPSSLWPPPTPALTDEIQNRLRSRVKEAVNRLRHHPPGADEAHRRASLSARRTRSVSPGHKGPPQSGPPGHKEVPAAAGSARTSEPTANDRTKTDEGDQQLHPVTDGGDPQGHPEPRGEPTHNPSRADPAAIFSTLEDRHDDGARSVRPTTLAQCDTPLVLSVKGEDVEIDTQIQLYATNAQLCHPWVSPAVGYLGGLPPLLIIAGDNEVLRDEIIFMAHKAANPGQYPIREDVRAMLPSLEGIEDRHGPTKVHLQVYDGACHDLPLFSMTRPARGVFRAIASFARYVTPSAPGSLSISKSLAVTPTESRSGTSTPLPTPPPTATPHAPNHQATEPHVLFQEEQITKSPRSLTPRSSTLEMSLSTTLDNSGQPRQTSSTPPPSGHLPMQPKPGRSKSLAPPGDDAGPRWDDADDPASRDTRAKAGEAGHPGIYRGEDPFGPDGMIRERVSTSGVCRPLEPPEELPAMTMPADEIGMIKEGPAMRYLNGQALWQKRYSRAVKTVKRHRERNLKEAKERDVKRIQGMWREKLKKYEEGHGHDHEGGSDEESELSDDSDDEGRHRDSQEVKRGRGKEEEKAKSVLDQSWSWTWALNGEAPPPSAIVSRRDFGEARQLALMADRMDSGHDTPMHGLSIWVGLTAFFSNSSDRSKAGEAVRRATEVRKAEREERRRISHVEEQEERHRRGEAGMGAGDAQGAIGPGKHEGSKGGLKTVVRRLGAMLRLGGKRRGGAAKDKTGLEAAE